MIILLLTILSILSLLKLIALHDMRKSIRDLPKKISFFAIQKIEEKIKNLSKEVEELKNATTVDKKK